MIKIIIVAHGNFPDGILSSLELKIPSGICCWY